MKIFSTKGAEKRRQHGSKGATVFRDPNEDDRVWVLFDWDAEGWQSFVSDPEVPPIMQEAGHKGRPQVGGARRPATTPSAFAPRSSWRPPAPWDDVWSSPGTPESSAIGG